MNIQAAITHLQAGRCVCKHFEQALEKLSKLVEEGFHQANVTFGSRLVILENENGREVLCSRFLEQRD
jgi:regulator of replication initiation timing